MSQTPSDLICNEILDESIDKGPQATSSASNLRHPLAQPLPTSSFIPQAAGSTVLGNQQQLRAGYATGASNNKYSVRGAGSAASPSLPTASQPAPSVSRPTYSVASQPTLGRVIQSPIPPHSTSSPTPILTASNSAATALAQAAAQTNLQRIGFSTPAQQHNTMSKFLFNSFTDPLAEIGGGTLKASTPISSTITNLNYSYSQNKPTVQTQSTPASNIIRNAASSAIAASSLSPQAQSKQQTASSSSVASSVQSTPTLAQLTAQQQLVQIQQIAAQQQAVGMALKLQEAQRQAQLIQAARSAAALATFQQQAQAQSQQPNRMTLDYLRQQQQQALNQQSQNQNLLANLQSMAAQSHALSGTGQQTYNSLASPQPKIQQRNTITPVSQSRIGNATTISVLNAQRQTVQTLQSQIPKPSPINSYAPSGSTITPQLTAFGSTSSRLLPGSQIVTPQSQQPNISPYNYSNMIQQSPQTPQHQIVQQSMTTPSPRPTILRKRGDGAGTPNAKRKLPFGDQPSTSSNVVQNSGVLSINQSVIQHSQTQNRVEEIKPSGTPEESPKKRNRKQVFEHEESTENVKVAIQVPTNLLTQMDQKKRGRPRMESKYSTHPTIQIPETTKIFVDLESPEEKVKKPDLAGQYYHKPGIPPHALAHSSHSGEYSTRGTRGGRGMRGRMNLLNSQRASPMKPGTPTSGPLLPSNVSMQSSYGRGGTVRGGGGVRQNLYGAKHSAEENSPPPEYSNHIPTVQKHARGPNISGSGRRGRGGSSEVAAANILRAKAIYNADQRSEDGKRVLTAAEKKMGLIQKKPYLSTRLNDRSRESSAEVSSMRGSKMVNGFTKEEKSRKKLLKPEKTVKKVGRAPLKRGRKPGPGRGKKGPMKKSENIAVLTHLKPHLYLNLQQMKALEAKQRILERKRIAEEMQEEDEEGEEKVRQAMLKSLEVKKWNLEKREQKAAVFLANTLRKTQKERDLDRKIEDARTKLMKIQSIALDQPSSSKIERNERSIFNGYPLKINQQKFIYKSPELLHLLVQTNREYEDLLYRKKKLNDKQIANIDIHSKKIINEIERRLAGKAEYLNTINTDLTSGWCKMTPEGEKSFQKLVRQMLKDRLNERKIRDKSSTKKSLSTKLDSYRPSLKLTVISEPKSIDSEQPSTSKEQHYPIMMEATETVVEELLDEMISYVVDKVGKDEFANVDSLASRSAARVVRMMPLNSEGCQHNAELILRAYKSIHRITGAPSYSRIITNISKNRSPSMKETSAPTIVVDNEGRVRDVKSEKWWQAVSQLSNIKIDKVTLAQSRKSSKPIKIEDDMVEIDIKEDSNKLTAIEGPNLEEDNEELKSCHVKISKDSAANFYNLSIIQTASTDHEHVLHLKRPNGSFINRPIKVPLVKIVKVYKVTNGDTIIHKLRDGHHAEGIAEEKIMKKLKTADGKEMWRIEPTPESRMTKIQNITRRVLKKDGRQEFITSKRIILAKEDENEFVEEITEIKKEMTEIDKEREEEEVTIARAGMTIKKHKTEDFIDGREIVVKQAEDGTRIYAKCPEIKRVGKVKIEADGRKLVTWKNVLKGIADSERVKILKKSNDGTEYLKKIKRNGQIEILKKKDGKLMKLKRKSRFETKETEESEASVKQESDETHSIPARPILVKTPENGKLVRQNMVLVRQKNGEIGLIGLNRLKTIITTKLKKQTSIQRKLTLRGDLKKACKSVTINGDALLVLKRNGKVARKILAKKVESVDEYQEKRKEDAKMRDVRRMEHQRRLYGIPTFYRILCRRVERFNEDVVMYERLEREICDTYMEFVERYDPSLYWQIVSAIGKDRCKEDTEEDIELKRYQRIRQAILSPPIEAVPCDKKFVYGEASGNVVINPNMAQVNCTMKSLSPFWKGPRLATNDDGTFIDRRGTLNFEMDDSYFPLGSDYKEIFLREFEKGLNKEKLDSAIRSFDRYLDHVSRLVLRRLYPTDEVRNVSEISNGESRRSKVRSDSSEIIPLAEGPSNIPQIPALLQAKIDEFKSKKMRKMIGERVEHTGFDRLESILKDMKLKAVPIREKFAAALKGHHLSLLLAMQRRDALLAALLSTAPEENYPGIDDVNLDDSTDDTLFKMPNLPKYKRLTKQAKGSMTILKSRRSPDVVESPTMNGNSKEPKPPSRRAAVISAVTNAVNAVGVPEEEDEIFYNEQLQQAIKASLKDFSSDAPSTSRD